MHTAAWWKNGLPSHGRRRGRGAALYVYKRYYNAWTTRQDKGVRRNENQPPAKLFSVAKVCTNLSVGLFLDGEKRHNCCRASDAPLDLPGSNIYFPGTPAVSTTSIQPVKRLFPGGCCEHGITAVPSLTTLTTATKSASNEFRQ